MLSRARRHGWKVLQLPMESSLQLETRLPCGRYPQTTQAAACPATARVCNSATRSCCLRGLTRQGGTKNYSATTLPRSGGTQPHIRIRRQHRKLTGCDPDTRSKMRMRSRAGIRHSDVMQDRSSVMICLPEPPPHIRMLCTASIYLLCSSLHCVIVEHAFRGVSRRQASRSFGFSGTLQGKEYCVLLRGYDPQQRARLQALSITRSDVNYAQRTRIAAPRNVPGSLHHATYQDRCTPLLFVFDIEKQ